MFLFFNNFTVFNLNVICKRNGINFLINFNPPQTNTNRFNYLTITTFCSSFSLMMHFQDIKDLICFKKLSLPYFNAGSYNITTCIEI